MAKPVAHVEAQELTTAFIGRVGPKPGWQTTEFWGHLLTQVIALLTLVGEFNTASPLGNALIKLAAVLGSAGSYAGYAASRGKAKAVTP